MVEQFSDVFAEATQASGNSSETQMLYDVLVKRPGDFFMCRMKRLSLQGCSWKAYLKKGEQWSGFKMGLSMKLFARGVRVAGGRLQVQVAGSRGEVLQRSG